MDPAEKCNYLQTDGCLMEMTPYIRGHHNPYIISRHRPNHLFLRPFSSFHQITVQNPHGNPFPSIHPFIHPFHRI